MIKRFFRNSKINQKLFYIQNNFFLFLNLFLFFYHIRYKLNWLGINKILKLRIFSTAHTMTTLSPSRLFDIF